MMQIKEILFWRQSIAKMITIQPIHNSFTCMQQSRRFVNCFAQINLVNFKPLKNLK